ncbi:hypothetical protein SK128_018624 [Halocaridina rubra]|uniref:Uncharacterized protein n=1 Tax=Halocaridina rubra TaxID=373956 RepID=A0AAN9A816_HALRR
MDIRRGYYRMSSIIWHEDTVPTERQPTQLHETWHRQHVFDSCSNGKVLLAVVTALSIAHLCRSNLPSVKTLRKIAVHPCNCSRLLHVKEEKLSPSIPSDSSIILQSSCSDLSTARGPGQKVVSYSLYGSFPSEYYEGFLKQLPRVKEAYKEWTVRVYLDLTSEDVREWACSVACDNQHLDLCDVKAIPGIGDISDSGGTAWRFMVVGDALVDQYIVRDTDSPIIQRELDAVQEWFHSGKCFHVMRDHYNHRVSMMGGMWGGCNAKPFRLLQDIRKNLIEHTTHEKVDQQILQEYMWPVVKKDVIMHDSYLCELFPGSLPFPSKRVNLTFVGMRSYRELFMGDNVETPCPVECRPPNHKDWEYC